MSDNEKDIILEKYIMNLNAVTPALSALRPMVANLKRLAFRPY
jgi:hypothetical protein